MASPLFLSSEPKRRGTNGTRSHQDLVESKEEQVNRTSHSHIVWVHWTLSNPTGHCLVRSDFVWVRVSGMGLKI
jgi:hypothetical protein